MSRDERWVSLDEGATFYSGGTPSKANPDYWGGDVPWVSAKDMKTFRLYDAEDHVTAAGVENGTRIAPTGATLILTRGMTLLSDVPICAAERPVAFNQDVKALVPKAGVVGRYLSYAILNAKQGLLGAVDLAGHGTGRLPTDVVRSVRIRLPVESEQHDIASVFGALDDKIELNRRTSETLEAMTQAIFTSWFVDFDPVCAKAAGESDESICERLRLTPELLALFPEGFQDSTLGAIPAGWSVTGLDAFANLSTSSVSPGAAPDELFEHYSIPAFDAGRTPSYELGRTIKSNKYKVARRAVLVSKLNPNTPRVWLPEVKTERAVCSTEFMQFEPRWAYGRTFVYLQLQSEYVQAEIQQRVTGSTGSRQRAQPSQIATLPVLMPRASLIQAAEAILEPLLRMVATNAEEAMALAAQRDSLLPALLSGAIAIPPALLAAASDAAESSRLAAADD